MTGMRNFLYLLPVLLLSLGACRSKSPAAPAKLPPPASASGPPAAVLVWLVPEDHDLPALDRQGVWEVPARARTFWVSPAGSAWVVSGERPGLFLATGDRLLEARLTPFHHQTSTLPPEAEGEHENLEVCRTMLTGDYATGLEAKGHGLVLREFPAGAVTELFRAPKAMEDAEWAEEFQQSVELVGGLGPYLFLRVDSLETACGSQGEPYEDFHVHDLSTGRDVSAALVGTGPPRGSWLEHVDTPELRKKVTPGMKQQLREYEEGMEFDPEDLRFFTMTPVFAPAAPGAAPGAAAVALRIKYRYWAQCRGCPSFDESAETDQFPPELAAWRDRHPAVELVAGQLPEGWRLAGVTRLDASPDRVKTLRAAFLAK